MAPDTAIAAARRRVRDALVAAGIPDAETDARHLVALACGLDPAGLIVAADRPLGAAAAATLDRLVARRLAREPVARLIGAREFWGLRFALSPATLVPRPDTETLVEAVLEARPDRAVALRLADLGTGTGALLAALLVEYPQAIGVGTDRSLATLVAARANLDRLGLRDRAVLVAGDWGTALGGGFDVVVSNPPYIATGEIEGLDPEVRDHEPKAALDGGPDGLDAYRAILADLARLLRPGGLAVLELGAGQAASVAGIAASAGLVAVRTARDLAGIERALIAAAPEAAARGAGVKELGSGGKTD
ncbi:peptide chain release factor N(5)-glutamine methyltransferase [Blastochloris sulfoviridis]|uniref:Release factor glutamine methyltransferase n=1 Tax=Blastochloris sulfoviridis TaxID=50712 RepID=A0A5M6HRG9_9HYPH|nr:peptide chain release factor N(5)-glutamine methyltransferase [Blastochloris sulfoviridis]KAA5598298.1 peptide chain release factor N(5)-glutamine methyltransferase [Blastochloris sulfoviridis]